MYVYNFHLAMIYFFNFRKNSTQTASQRQKQKNPSIKQANIFSYTPAQPTCVAVTTRMLFSYHNDAVFILSTHARTFYIKARITFTRFHNQYTFGTPKHPSEKTPVKLLAYPLREKHKRMFFAYMYHTTKLFL